MCVRSLAQSTAGNMERVLSATTVSESNKLWVRFQLWLLPALCPTTSCHRSAAAVSCMGDGNKSTWASTLYASNIKLDSGQKALPGTMGQSAHLCF